MQKFKLAIFVFILIITGSCKKLVEKKYPEFIGDWANLPQRETEYSFLNISKDSYAKFHIFHEGAWIDYEGNARANEKHLKIGRTDYFEIIEYPHKIDTNVERVYIEPANIFEKRKLANWKMVLFGLKPAWYHADREWSFYRADY